MRAVLPTRPGLAEPELGTVPDPVPDRGEVLVEVRAAGLNRADLLQLRGLYPPPAGESHIPGLELAGTIREVGEGVTGWKGGDRVMALTAGGAHAELAAVPAGQLMSLPESLSFPDGAAIPEAGLTAWTNLVAEGGLQAGETVLVTGATGGIGRTVVQLASALGARVLAAGRVPDRLAPLRALGADELVLLDERLAERVREATAGRGADLVFDLVGGEHLPRCLAALAPRGRCVLVGLMAGARAELDLADLLRRRLHLLGSVLRSRPREEKARLVAAFAAFALPRYADGRLTPQIDRTYPFDRVADAYSHLGQGDLEGKVLVEIERT